MSADAYKLTTLNLFTDLKKTNIKNEDFKQILSSYQKLASYYIKANEADLFKDLNKQKDAIFSYIPSLSKQSIKKVASLYKQLETEVGNIDEIDTCETPDKQVQFVKVAYNNGKWTISAKNFDGAEFTNKETSQAIGCLVNLASRMDEQEAAYALCHAKKAGLFTMAELPYVRTQDFTNTALEQRYVKEPGTVLGPVDHSWDSTVDNANMPVSRQIASEEDTIKEMDTFKDKDGDTVTVSTVSGDAVITFDNNIYTKQEAEEKVKNGTWTKINASSVEAKLQKLDKEIDSLLVNWEEKLQLDEAAQRSKDAYGQKVDDEIKPRKEKLEESAQSVLPKIKKLAAKIDSITFNDQKGKRKFQYLKRKIGKLIVHYNREVSDYQTKAIATVSEVESLLDEARKYVSPKNLKAFEKNVVEKFFYTTKKEEDIHLTLDTKDPRNEEKVQELVEDITKNIKSTQNNFLKDAAYDYLDKLLISGHIDFNEYDKLSDLAEINAKPVLASLKQIKFNDSFNRQADLSGLKSLFIFIKGWISDTLSYVLGQEKQILDINEKLDEIIPEGE